jgi:hypothetical protein
VSLSQVERRRIAVCRIFCTRCPGMQVGCRERADALLKAESVCGGRVAEAPHGGCRALHARRRQVKTEWTRELSRLLKNAA